MEVTKVENQHVKVQEKINDVFDSSHSLSACCPIKDILGRFGDKWSIYAILMLGREEKLRFNELKSMIDGISQRMLTVTLRSLEEDGLVSRKIYPEIPPKVEYRLTELGQGLLLQLLQLADWAKLNLHEILEARKSFAER
ncbi:helix-turn-helix transcriptional regulator [Pontibacter qinzhouensis]|uniref:Helix-turn-helix transcriptional regulator n=1 Tax=Pontibacter qinzhouensis TaxID=2603253 RepID=A0A5C8J578_9BACT|nr:helix-turn-helix domain-containing protein [Pontibacter qinzhouensis]TXK31149.1 helix-turn-helix transcriptional regulator [Pontibacter qinzhouensis]